MSDRTSEKLPPLGEPTPGRPVASRIRMPLVALAGLVVGLVAGFAIGQVVADDDVRDEAEDPGRIATTLPRPTTTAPLAVPAECRDAMRSAEQALGLLDEGFQSLRTFQVGEIEAVLRDMERLRTVLSDRVRQCLEQA
ncbi:MAG: hypothetical protein ACLGI2_00045 [Acidimicrobiia bacterium]